MSSNLHDTSFYSQSKQSTSTVQQLYEKFQSLKHRIVTSDVKKLNKSIDKRSVFQNRRKVANSKPIQLEKEHYSIQLEDQHNKKYSNSVSSFGCSFKDLIEDNLFRFIHDNMLVLEQNMKMKIVGLQKKLNNSNALIKNLKNSLRKKEDNAKIHIQKGQKLNMSCEAQTKQKSILSFRSPSQNLINLREVSQISKKYQKQIKSIIENYENKISLLISQGSQKQKNTKASSSDKKSQLSQTNLLKQCKSFQEKLLLKQQELNQLRIDNNRLKRMIDQSSKNYQSNSQLNRLLKEQNKQLEQNLKKMEAYKKNWTNQRKQLEGEIQRLRLHEKKELKIYKQELKRLNLQLKTLKQSNAIKQIVQQKQQNIQKNEAIQIQNGSNMLEQLETVKSLQSNSINKQQKIYQNLELDFQGIHTQLKHCQSLVWLNKNKPKTNQIQSQIKSLISEVNLLSEQNKLLKMKKDKFHQQIKNSEEDQKRFQQQSEIFKSQIKRLNGFVRKLQDCGIILIKKQQLTVDKVNELQEQSRLKELFYKMKVKVGDTARRGNSCRK